MTPAEMLKAKLNGWAEVNAITAAEEGAKTPAQRLRELDVFTFPPKPWAGGAATPKRKSKPCGKPGCGSIMPRDDELPAPLAEAAAAFGHARFTPARWRSSNPTAPLPRLRSAASGGSDSWDFPRLTRGALPLPSSHEHRHADFDNRHDGPNPAPLSRNPFLSLRSFARMRRWAGIRRTV